MEVFQSRSPRELSNDLIGRIADGWMLVAAGSPQKGVATMTVNWGAMGYLWHKELAMVTIRKSRHTLPYMEECGGFSLNLLGPEYREEMTYCGRTSGWKEDKVAHCGFTTAYEKGIPYFTQAHTALICRTMYEGDILRENFKDETLFRRWYTEGPHKDDMHKLFLAAIETVLEKVQSP